MSLEQWNRGLSWAAIVLPLLTIIASAGALYTRNVLAARSAATIAMLEPWKVSAEQKAKIKSRVSSLAGKIAFITRLMDGEGKDFAEQLAATFKDAGWTIASIAGNSLNDLPGAVTVAVSNSNLQATADQVCEALNFAGIKCGGDLRPNSLGGPLEPDTIYIIIGRKIRT
jgi:hypothetical protein